VNRHGEQKGEQVLAHWIDLTPYFALAIGILLLFVRILSSAIRAVPE
jgi:hypothetical protein